MIILLVVKWNNDLNIVRKALGIITIIASAIGTNFIGDESNITYDVVKNVSSKATKGSICSKHFLL